MPFVFIETAPVVALTVAPKELTYPGTLILASIVAPVVWGAAIAYDAVTPAGKVNEGT